MGLATLRLDGFTCLESADRETPGHFVTRPVRLTEGSLDLVLNTSGGQQGRSWLEVEVLSAEDGGSPLPGYSREECTPICLDRIRAPVRWRGNPLAKAGRELVRLRFLFYGAVRLYSFGFDRI